MATALATTLKLTGGGNERLRMLGESAYLCLYQALLPDAERLFEALRVLAPDDPTGWLGLAEVRVAQQRWKDADRLAAEAAERPGADRERTSFAYTLRAKALDRLGKAREALRMLERAASMDPAGPAGKSAAARLGLHAATDQRSLTNAG